MAKKILITRSSMPPYEEYAEAIKHLWETHWLTNMGTYHKELERKLKDYLGVSEVSLIVNGHMALEMAIQMMDFPKGAEVITTPFTFISTTHAIIRNGLKPVFCDVKESDGTIDETKIEDLITEKTVAIVPVHVYGNVCNVVEIQKIADKYNLKVIYDAAHAFGVKYQGKGIGNYGDASVFSFHATKVFNTIEGGAVTFKEHAYYEKLYELKNFGIRGEEIVASIGANAKMNEFCAIMGLCNLKYINVWTKQRKEKYQVYKEKLEKIEGIEVFCHGDETDWNYAYLPIRVTEKYALTRNEVYKMYADNDVHVRKYFYPLTVDQICFGNEFKKSNLSVARKLSEEILTLPLWPDIEYEIIDFVTNLLTKYAK